jgi:transposase
MVKLAGVSSDALRDALDDVDDAKAAMRLMVALAYKDGVGVDTLSDRYGVPESTLYAWLDRFESAPVREAATDDSRPGRPPKLSAGQRRTVAGWLRSSPREHGIDADEWTPTLLRERVRDQFGTDYSLGHLRRLRDELSDGSN